VKRKTREDERGALERRAFYCEIRAAGSALNFLVGDRSGAP